MNESNHLHHFLDTNLISVSKQISSPKKLLQEMASLLANSPHVVIEDEDLEEDDHDEVSKLIYHCLLEREKIGNTGIGNGVALPHSRCNMAQQAIIAVITLSEAIDYDSLDKQKVNIAFGILVPQEATQEHLGLLAQIARLMSDDGHRQKLVEAETKEQIMELISAWVENSS